jgi:hypothetical protein
MATLDNLTNLIANAKSTPSGKIEWTDISLKGIQQEVEYLFSQNAIQVINNTTTLQSTINDNSQLAFVTSDPTDSNNGIYFWSLTAVSTINYPAGSNGFWNLIEFGVTSSIAAGYIPYSNGSNLVASYLQRTTDEIKMVGGSFVANKSTSTGPYFQCGDTDSTGNRVTFTIDDKNQLIYSKKNTSNKGIKLNLAGDIFEIGDIDNHKGLYISSGTPTYVLGNNSTATGVVMNATQGYMGSLTWGYNFSPTTLVAGNTSISLYLDDSQNTASVGDSTKGLFIDLINTIYTLGAATNGLVINTTGAYTLGNGTNGLDINTTTNTYKLGISTKGLNISTSSDSYKLGNTSTNVGVILNSAGGYLGSSTFGYNYLATSLVMGNASIGVTLDDPSNTAYIGTNTQGLLVDVTNSLYVLGNLSTSTGLSLGATTGYLGSSTFGYNFTATTLVAGNSSINLTINDTANTANLGIATNGLLVDVTNSVYKLGDLSTSTGISLGATTGYLGNSTFGYNFTATTMIAGNSSINLTLNDSLNKANLGTSTKGVVIDANNSVYSIGDLSGGNSSILTIDDANAFAVLKTGVSNSDCSLQLDHQAASVILSAGVTNNTTLTLNDSTDTLQVDAANIVIDTTLDVAPGKNYTQRSIPVTVNGVSYYIPLYL